MSELQPLLPRSFHPVLSDYASKMRAGRTLHTRPDLPLVPGKRLVAEIARSYGFTPEALLRKGNQPQFTEARVACYQALHKQLHLSYPQIGRLFHRHHSTILKNVERHHGLKSKPQPAPDYDRLIAETLDRMAAEMAELRSLIQHRRTHEHTQAH